MWIYFVIINLVAFLAMGIDKGRARRKAWRIPEKYLFLFAILGGAAGAWAGMYVFRHKTKHWYFAIGMPFLMLIEFGVIVYFMFS